MCDAAGYRGNSVSKRFCHSSTMKCRANTTAQETSNGGVPAVGAGQRQAGGQVTPGIRDWKGQRLQLPMILLCSLGQITFSLWTSISQQ